MITITTARTQNTIHGLKGYDLESYWDEIDSASSDNYLARMRAIQKATRLSLESLGLIYEPNEVIPKINPGDLERYLNDRGKLPKVETPTQLLLAVFNIDNGRIAENLRRQQFFKDFVVPKLESLNLAQMLRRNKTRNKFSCQLGDKIEKRLNGRREITLASFKRIIGPLISGSKRVFKATMPSDEDLRLIMMDLNLVEVQTDVPRALAAVPEQNTEEWRKIIENNWEKISQMTGVYRKKVGETWVYYFDKAKSANNWSGKFQNGQNCLFNYPNATFIKKIIEMDKIRSIENLAKVWSALGLECKLTAA